MMYFTMASVTSLNCSMMDALAGSFGSGIFKSILFATQTFSFEFRARARTPIPTWKVSTLDGSFAGNRTTVSDEELATQTRFWELMTMSKGDSRPAGFTILPSLICPPGK